MTTMTRKGATVEEAIEAALQKLNVSRDEVEIEVLDQGRKGFFGFGAKEAEVTVTVIKSDNCSTFRTKEAGPEIKLEQFVTESPIVEEEQVNDKSDFQSKM